MQCSLHVSGGHEESFFKSVAPPRKALPTYFQMPVFSNSCSCLENRPPFSGTIQGPLCLRLQGPAPAPDTQACADIYKRAQVGARARLSKDRLTNLRAMAGALMRLITERWSNGTADQGVFGYLNPRQPYKNKPKNLKPRTLSLGPGAVCQLCCTLLPNSR